MRVSRPSTRARPYWLGREARGFNASGDFMQITLEELNNYSGLMTSRKHDILRQASALRR
jgi:hypothetical protein